MKIAFFVDAFPRESQRFILNQVIGLLERDHDVTVFSTSKPDGDDIATSEHNLVERTVYTPIPSNRKERVLQSPQLFFRGISQSPVPVFKACNPIRFGQDALSLRPLYRAVPMLDESFDVVHAHFGPNGRIAAILKQIGIPGSLVTTFHGHGVRQAKKHPERYSRLFSVGDRFLANSRYTYQELVDLGIDKEKLTVHYNSIKVNEFPFRWSGPLETLPDPIKLITVARLEEVKGLEYTLRAVARLQENNDETFEYHIVGDGSKRSALKSLADELGIASAVTFHGHKHRDTVKTLLAESHLFLLPSLEEAFGMVLLEAQAVGLPIVASNIGGIPEAVSAGTTAKLVTPGDHDAISTAIEAWIYDVQEWAEIGADGRKYVRENFDMDVISEDLVEIYQKLKFSG